ncbi:MAG: DUF2950 family protein [Planctomycetes bacterium]|nr:DUF2950 family protein [Planctomycetota bacterium]
MNRLTKLALVAAAWCFAGCAGTTPPPQPSPAPDPPPSPAPAPATGQRVFPSPQHAVAALVEIARTGNVSALKPLFGPKFDTLAAQGIDVTPADLRTFVEKFDAQNTIAQNDDGTVILLYGADGSEFPAPLILDGDDWRFDTDAGIAAMKDRRATPHR